MMPCVALWGISFLSGCENNPGEDKDFNASTTSEVYISLGEVKESSTRVTHDIYDNWSIATFSSGDVVGFYTLKGRQDPANDSKFDQSVVNEPMYYEGRIGNYYRFSNPDIVLDALTVGGTYSRMYYPFIPDMPSTSDKSKIRGIPLRQTDSDGIVKCVDFMYSNNTSITLSNGMLQPTFNHYCGVIGIQRGEGFKRASEREIYVVMQEPYTDIRITQNSETSSFDYTIQNSDSESDDILISINPDKPNQKVNKNRVWQCWQGNDYQGTETYYVLVPPGVVSYVLLQNDLGEWKAVSDFYLSGTGSKNISSNYRYMLNLSMQGLVPVVRPIFIGEWNEEIKITDDRKVGIQSVEEFETWVSVYNTYIEKGRDEDYLDRLIPFGDAVRTGADGPVSWRFYINDNLPLQTTGFYTITRLEDILEGSSVYTNYSVSNLRHTLIEEMAEGGELRALDFDELYVIDTTPGAQDVCGGLIRNMEGGIVSHCNVRNGIIVSDKKTGMVAGAIHGGTVEDCFLSGDVIGSASDSDYPGIFGEMFGNPEVSGNDSRQLNFMNYQ